MESPGSGPGGAAAGLAIARVLADRGQAVVLVDGDEQEPRITRWLGRVEQEGWIDMVRFGASLHAASDPLPSDNRRGSVLGVGSFAPTGVTPDEVADLLARLRRQADDLVLVLPAKLRSQPWFEASHIKLLSWDLLSRSAADTEKVIAELDRMGARPDALLGFGVEEFTAIQGKLREDDHEDGLAPLPPEDVDETPAPLETEPETEPVAVVEPETPEAITEPVFEREPEPVPELTPPPVIEKKRRRSSGIFVFVAVVAVACLILLGVFLVGQRGGPGDGEEQTVAAAGMDARGGDAVRQPDEVTPPPASEEMEDVSEPAAAGGIEETTTEALVAEPVADDAGAGVAPVQQPVQPIDQPVDQPPAAEPEPEAAAPDSDQAAFQLPVGQDGWALWLYSFPELDLAEAEIRRLERRGIRAEYRTVDIEDKGRWYRVYVGSFADRAAAKAAVDGLKARLKHDWVVPARI